MTSVEFEVSKVDRTDEEFIETHDIGDEIIEKTTEEAVIHCFGYTPDGEDCHVKVRGFRPYCYVPYSELDEFSGGTLHTSDGNTLDCITDIELYDSEDDPFESVRGERVAKVYTEMPGDVPDVDSAFSKTWESDVLFPQRFMTDLDIRRGIRAPDTDGYVHVDDVEVVDDVVGDWRLHMMDIEVDDRNGFPENGDEPILCITAYDNFRDEYITWLQSHGEHGEYPKESGMHGSSVEVRWYDDEKTMLRSYLAYVKATNPAIIAGWNADDFDYPYLVDRCEELEVEIEMLSPLGVARYNNWGPQAKGVVIFDLLEGFKATQQTEMDSYRLDSVAEHVVGETKEAYVGKIGDLWEDDPQALVDYNIRDVELCVEINRRQAVVPFWKDVKSYAACQLEDAIIESSVVDRYLLMQLHGERVLPRQSHGGSGDDYEGGEVFSAVDGLYENVSVLDLKSLYPMSMLTINASPETYVPNPEEYDGETFKSPPIKFADDEEERAIHFKKDELGITRQLIEDLLKKREAKKAERDSYDPDSEEYAVRDRQQTAIKVIMNSLYGVMAWSRFRLYSVESAAAVTATGRGVLEYTADTVEEEGWDVLYGDTDSVMLDLEDGMPKMDIIEESFRLSDLINASYDAFARDVLNANEHHFEIEFEKLYKLYFQSDSKKRYAGHIIWKEGKDVDDVDIIGYQYKRSDTSPFTKEVQKRVIELIVHGEPPEDVAKFVFEEYKKFMRGEVSISDIGLPQGIGKRLNQYDADTHTPLAAKYSNMLLDQSFSKGSKPKRYYLEDIHPSFFTRVEEEYGLDTTRDRKYAEFKENPWMLAVDQPEELPQEVEIDWEQMMVKNLKHPMRSITSSIGYDWDDIEEAESKAELSDFTA